MILQQIVRFCVTCICLMFFSYDVFVCLNITCVFYVLASYMINLLFLGRTDLNEVAA
jgi:hypothetical protein